MRLLPVSICFLAALFVSCGGGGSKATTPTAVETVSPQAEETAEPSIPDPFASLNSYDYEFKVITDGQGQVEVKGTIQAPDRVAADFLAGGSSTPLGSAIIIGNQAWIKDSSTENEWVTTDLGTAESILAGARPKDIWNLLPTDQLTTQANDLGEENVNGVASHHLQVGSLSSDAQNVLGAFFGISVASGTVDLWQADNGGWPAKAQIKVSFVSGEVVSSAEADWDASNINNASVQPPQ
jgi:hypothetical protein